MRAWVRAELAVAQAELEVLDGEWEARLLEVEAVCRRAGGVGHPMHEAWLRPHRDDL